MKIDVILTASVFRRFTLFNTMIRRKMWRSPVIFASILSGCACICFLMHHIDGAVLLGSVLLFVGLGVPLASFTSFFYSLHKEVQKQNLTPPRQVYTLELNGEPDGIFIRNKTEKATYKWEQVFHAYKNKDAIYLFLNAVQGFILPHECIKEGPDALWALISKMVPENRRTIL